MNINGIRSKSIKQKAKSGAKTSSPDISFSTLLAGQIQPPLEAQQTAALAEIQNKSSSASTRTAGITLTENTIDVLAAYGDALSDLQLSKDDIRPLIEALEEGTTSLLDIKEQLDTDDPLAELLDRVAAIAYLESEKFRRGDYDT